MKKRLIATLVSLITMIGALISTPAIAAGTVRVEYNTFVCSRGYFTIDLTYFNDDVSEQTFGATLDGIAVDGSFVVAPGASLETVTVLTTWKPRINTVSVFRTTVNGVAFGYPVPLDNPRCDALGIPKVKNIVPPTIVGTLAVGRTVSATTGKWSSAKLNFGYRWFVQNSNGYMIPIVGAYGRTYKIKASNKGRKIMVDVVAGSGSIVENRASSASKKVR